MQVPVMTRISSDRMVVDILDAASTYDEREVIEALNYLYRERG